MKTTGTLNPIATAFVAVLLSLFAGCATTSQHSAIHSYSAEAFDPGPSWRQVDGTPNRYAPADLSRDTALDYRNGGWVMAHGMEFFIPHKSRAGESEALIESLIGPPTVGEKIVEASIFAGQALTGIALNTLAGLPSP